MATSYVAYDGPIVTREEAKAAGLKRYFTGQPCLRGHLSERHVVNKRCRTCFYLLRKPRDDKARRTARVWAKTYRVAKRARRLAVKRAYYYANKAKVIAQNEATRKKQIDGYQCSVRNYRARKRLAEGKHTAADIAAILKAQNGKCAYCRGRVGTDYDVDHIKPLSGGGTNNRANLQITCKRCNRSKGALDPIDFARLVGLLV